MRSKYNLISIVTIFLLPECFQSGVQGCFISEHKDRTFLLILLDGFRWDYLDRPNLKGFEEIERIGCRAKYLKPVFPTLSYPNYYTIVTGLFVENHGITLNQMYNQKTKEQFDSSPIWWNQTEPLWITTTKAGMVTDMYHWPGCEVKIRGYVPNSCVPYAQKVTTLSFESDLNQVLGKFARNESKIALVYCEQPDLFGHLKGPYSFWVNRVLHKLDRIMYRFLRKLKSKGLQDKVNVIIVSDHGMTPVDTWSADLVPMADYMDLEDVDKVLDRGAVVGIYPKPGKVDKVVQSLKLMPKTRVWLKGDIPEAFHYKNNVNTPPVLLLANPGVFIGGINDPEKTILSHGLVPPFLADRVIDGAHGYDPNALPDMRGIFMAFGPDFKKNYVGPPIGNEDVYNLAMTVIGLPPNPNNGTWAKVVTFLARKPRQIENNTICSNPKNAIKIKTKTNKTRNKAKKQSKKFIKKIPKRVKN